MARVVIADDGIRFDGRTIESAPLGGVESAVVMLAEALAARGHEVRVRNMCAAPVVHNGVDWAPLADGLPAGADLYVANRGDRLIRLMPEARRTVFWVHNPASYLLKWRYLWKLWSARPAIVFLGPYHLSTYPRWAPAGERVLIPYGVPEVFRCASPADGPPGPRAIFTSNPLRSLDWLLAVWATHIRPRVPAAELHLFTGAATYGRVGEAKAGEMEAVLARADALSGAGVVRHGPVPKAHLIEELRGSRLLLYRGDPNEVYCLAVAEAQALGVPAVVAPIGSLPERVADGETGFVADGAESFAERAVALLTDDGLWLRQHETALRRQRAWGWPEAAAAFEALIP
ncbi:MAG: glycosyltransferase family 4 protein [Proteobacteria bacterium]|nr:glycosyltransferase family 4 protein [Pseudomonadota bacterium]